jgi:hypothetical protein
MKNLISCEYLEKIKTQVLSNLERTRHAPSVQTTAVVRESIDHQAEHQAMRDDHAQDKSKMPGQLEHRVERPMSSVPRPALRLSRRSH